MDAKLEFSDPYKFLISIGTAFLVFSLALPLLLLQAPFDLLVTTSDIATFTPTAQAILIEKQKVGLWLIENLAWLSLSTGGLGIITVITGLSFWYKRYKQEEEIKIFEERKKRLEAQSLPLNRYQDAIDELSRRLGANNGETTDDVLLSAKFQNVYSDFKKHTETSFRVTHRVRELKLSQGYYLSLHSLYSPKHHAIVDVRYMTKTNDLNWQSEAIAKLCLVSDLYAEEINKAIIPVIFFIYPNAEEINKNSLQLISEKIGRLSKKIRITGAQETGMVMI